MRPVSEVGEGPESACHGHKLAQSSDTAMTRNAFVLC